jgi:hypothetical protein
LPSPFSIFLLSLLIFGIVQLGRQVRAQSAKMITNSIRIKLVLIANGTFQVGSPIEEEGAAIDEEQNQVTISARLLPRRDRNHPTPIREGGGNQPESLPEASHPQVLQIDVYCQDSSVGRCG